MYRIKFISEPNQKEWYDIIDKLACDEVPDYPLEDGTDKSGDFLDIRDYISSEDWGNLIDGFLEFDYQTKSYKIEGEFNLENYNEEWETDVDVYDIESGLRNLTDCFEIHWKESSLLDEDGEEQW
ncbi:hypothetical protein OAH02_01400 [Flavobacteriaceae bacterium]|nr:hypothetical protein [Flavobacteriaceae bacterium]